MSTNDRHDDSGGADENKTLGVLVQDALPGKVFRIGATGSGANSLQFYFDDTLTGEEQTTLASVVTDYTPKNAIAYTPPSTGLLSEWADDPSVTSYIPLSEGTGNPIDTINEDAATVQTGTWVQVDIGGTLYWAIQVDGGTERVEFAALAARCNGLTTQGQFDLIVRVDAYTNLGAIACISNSILCNDDAYTFLLRFNTAAPALANYVRIGGAAPPSIGGAVSNGNTYHIRLIFDTTVALRRVRLFIDDMSTHVVESTLLTQDSTLENAGVTPFTFGALAGGGNNAGITVIESLIGGLNNFQVPEFAP